MSKTKSLWTSSTDCKCFDHASQVAGERCADELVDLFVDFQHVDDVFVTECTRDVQQTSVSFDTVDPRPRLHPTFDLLRVAVLHCIKSNQPIYDAKGSTLHKKYT